MNKGKKAICSSCGSENVQGTAIVVWNNLMQDWEMQGFDASTCFCVSCGAEYALKFESFSDDEYQELCRKAIQEIANNVYGEIDYEYSGRCMFGMKCVGVECENLDGAIEDANRYKILPSHRTDNMGMDYIIYWEGVKGD